MDKKPKFATQDENRGASIAEYRPLLVLVGIALLAAFALARAEAASIRGWMHYFMGFFLCQFAMLKLFHPEAFANGFEMYDLLAKKKKEYGYIYPYIELVLGLSFLAFTFPYLTYFITMVVMFFGAVGVGFALKKGLDINCPCMGSILEVPLSTVTLVEDLTMGVLALLMLFFI